MGAYCKSASLVFSKHASSRSIPMLSCFFFDRKTCGKMKVVGYVVAVVIYIAVLLYLLLGVLDLHLGFRIGGNLYAEEGFALQRSTCFVLLVLLISAGCYCFWRISRRSL